MSGPFLYLGETPDGPVQWLTAGGEPETGDLAAAAAALAGQPCTVFVPGTRVLLTRAAVPSRNRAHQARAVPYALEEELAGEVEQLHFALGEYAAGEVVVAVVDRSWLATWREALASAGVTALAMVPDLLALPWDGTRWCLLPGTGGVLVRTGAQAGFVADPSLLAALLAAALEEAGDLAPERLRLLPTGTADAALGALPLPAEREEPARPPLAWLARGYQTATALDLLQGAFDRGDGGEGLWRPWPPVAAMALLLLAVAGGLQVADHQRLRQESAALDQHIATLYREAFPNARAVVKPRFRIEQRLAELRAGSGGDQGFLKLLAAAAKPLATTPGTELRGLSYRNRSLSVDLRVPALQTLDRLKQTITAGGVTVTIQTATARDGGVESRLQISEAAG